MRGKNESKHTVDTLIGYNIRKIQKSMNLSIDEMAQPIGVTGVYIGLIERGDRGITLSNLLKLACSLGIPFSKFFLDEDGEIANLESVGLNIKEALHPESSYVMNTTNIEKYGNPKIKKSLFCLTNMSENDLDLVLTLIEKIYERPN